ncbi:MFS transporter [Stackebrandtia nassauensis]|uniref:MFS transporter n=1 Tax=Stackebrandtia nassauensis TaxID=283811 RepID=UPI001FCAC0AB|nr:MFS transporter [Stackebrandtia nassauensis]
MAVIFAVHGAVSGTFATRVPWISDRLHLTAGALGLALVCSALGAVLIMPVASRLVAMIGQRRTTRAAVIAYAATLAVPAFMPNTYLLGLSLWVMGAAAGICDVAMKSQANDVERRMGRAVMSRLYGLWSLGVLAGAGMGTAATFAGLDARLHFVWTAGTLLVIGGAASITVPRGVSAPVAKAAQARARTRIARPTRVLAIAAIIGGCASFAEATVHSFSAIYITEVTGGSVGAGSVAFVGFVASMAVGRLSGDALVSKFGPVRVVQTGGLLAFAGTALSVVAWHPAPALLAFAMVGLGIAAIVPVALSVGSRETETPGQGITIVLAAAQLGCVVAPGTIGAVSGALSLPVAFAVTAAVIIPLVFGATALRIRVAAPAAEPVAEAVEPVAAPIAAPLIELAEPARPGAAVGIVSMSAIAAARPIGFDDATVKLAVARRDTEPAELIHTGEIPVAVAA